jgi:flagellar basal-body rod protein FlgF
MDRMIYTAMTGAKQTMEQQSTVANNLANVNTTAFRAELATFRAVPINGTAQTTRVFVTDSTPGADLTPGNFQKTGRALDVAVQGTGWIAVRAKDGSEAYTRDGNLQVQADGSLTTHNGIPVLSDPGPGAPPAPIRVPLGSEVTVSLDGTVSATATQGGDIPPAITVAGKIRLVDPPASNMTRRDDGLFQTRDGRAAPTSASVLVAPQNLESSNVNLTHQMVQMIELSRQYELNTKMITTANDDEKAASQLLTLN